jgi:hypothetical protein
MTSPIPDNFAVFILTHGRADRVFTLDTITKLGYTGKFYLVIDNEDKQAEKYYDRFGEQRVKMFDKAAIAATFDEADNFGDRRAVIYARNACFEIAKDLGLDYFLELDDDYIYFAYQTDGNLRKKFTRVMRNLDNLILYMLDYYKSIPQAKAIAMSQGGDWIGGLENPIDKTINLRRKCMNTFFCSVHRPFQFVGRINEDVNTYTWFQSLGNLFITFPVLRVQQKETQSNVGGMNELYLDSGTYIKSFYTVMFQPSSVKVKLMQTNHKRLHHNVDWDYTVPCIIREEYRKK